MTDEFDGLKDEIGFKVEHIRWVNRGINASQPKYKYHGKRYVNFEVK